MSRRESVFFPESDSSLATTDSSGRSTPSRNESVLKLNEFLAYHDISPVRHQLTAPWDNVHEWTRGRYSRKVKQSVCAVLDTLAPGLGQSDRLWSTLTSNLSYEEKEMEPKRNEERSQCEKELIEALVESYNIASHWSTGRQILSIMADKMPLKELKHYIPGPL